MPRGILGLYPSIGNKSKLHVWYMYSNQFFQKKVDLISILYYSQHCLNLYTTLDKKLKPQHM